MMGAFLLFLLSPCSAAAQKIPAYVPIKFGTDSFVEFPVTIERHRSYYLNLIFLFESQEQRRLAKEIAGEPKDICQQQNECGKAASFNITIRTREQIVFHLKTKSHGIYAFTAKAFLRNICVVPLRPGRYNVRIDMIEFDSGINDVKTGIELTTDPRAADLGR
jgi:hypothetical protein